MRLNYKFFVALGLVFSLALLSVSLSGAEAASPLEQLKSGVPSDEIRCNADLVLVQKSKDNAAACVGESAAEMLIKRGWASKILAERPPEQGAGSDTWNPQSDAADDASVPGPAMSPSMALDSSVLREGGFASEGSMGLAVGGAQDINNFRKNISNGYLPLTTDITYEGLFYDYYFDTGNSQGCEKLFCPSYSYAVSRDPFSLEDEYYLSVGLNSGMKESDFERKKLNLVIVMDVSGSMSSPFSSYHYDQFGSNTQPHGQNGDDMNKSKMTIANESLVGLLDHLDGGDNLGVVLFSTGAHVSKPLENIGDADMQNLKDNILQIYPAGGTHMEAGMRLGTSLFDGAMLDPQEYENRIIFLTDAMPNLGNIDEDGLGGMLKANAENGIYATFIGIGLDFHTGLVDDLTKIRGANYYSVHSASEFRERMVDEFELMVTPLVFDLSLTVDADGYDIKQVYGSPEAGRSTGELLRVNTLFPSKTQDGETRGGIVLLKLEKTSPDAVLSLQTTFEDRRGNLDYDVVFVAFGQEESDYYENSGIHKGIVLSRYAEVMKTWIFYESISGLVEGLDDYEKEEILGGHALYVPEYHDAGIYQPDYVQVELGPWERQSAPLSVSSEYVGYFEELKAYLEDEMAKVGDESMSQELEILEQLVDL